MLVKYSQMLDKFTKILTFLLKNGNLSLQRVILGNRK
jgi:hypothetical protein